MARLYLLLFLIASFNFLSGQQMNISNDPRNYISVTEKTDDGESPVIWIANPGDSIYQKRKIVDTRSKIHISFHQKELMKNPSFKGNISITGSIVTEKGGDNPVEVFPYTQMGKEQKKVGKTNRPPLEIAKIFTNLLFETISIVQNKKPVEQTRKNFRYLIKRVNDLNEAVKNNPERPLKDLIDSYNSLINSYPDPPPFLQEIRFPSDSSNLLVVKSQIKEIHLKLKAYQRNDDFVELQRLRIAEKTASSLALISRYLVYFKSSGIQAEDAFLSFVELDYLRLDNLQEDIELHRLELIKLIEEAKNATSSQTSFKKISFLHARIIETLTPLAAINSEVAKDYEMTIEDKSPYNRISLLSSYSKSYSERINSWLDVLKNQRGDLSSFLAQRASKIIYANLHFATIDLLKERAAEGNILYLYVMVEETSRRTRSDQEPEIYQTILPIGRYELRETGWGVNVLDNFSLIDRLNQPDTLNNKNLSPSNFKGAPGVSLLAGYRRTGKPNHGLINFLQPSFGLDVSYVDFSTTSDVEVGVGTVLGLFRNQVFFQVGLNLNQTDKSEVSPFYFGIGFSFAKLAGRFSQ